TQCLSSFPTRRSSDLTGITIRPIGITGVYHNPINQILTVVFYAEYVSGEIEIQSNELIEAKFLELNEQNIDQYVTRNYIKASLRSEEHTSELQSRENL